MAAAVQVRLRTLYGDREPAQCRSMLDLSDLASVPFDPVVPFTDRLRLPVAAYLARFTGISRNRTESDLRCYLAWCAERVLDPLAAQRPHLELVHPVDAGDPPVQALHHVPAVLGHRRVLPDLRPGAFTRRARPPPVSLRLPRLVPAGDARHCR